MTRRDDEGVRPLRPRAAKSEVGIETLDIVHEAASAQVGRPKYEDLTVKVGLHDDDDVLLGDAGTHEVGHAAGGQDVEVENDETHVAGEEGRSYTLPEVGDLVAVVYAQRRPGGEVADHLDDKWELSEFDAVSAAPVHDRYADLETSYGGPADVEVEPPSLEAEGVDGVAPAPAVGDDVAFDLDRLPDLDA